MRRAPGAAPQRAGVSPRARARAPPPGSRRRARTSARYHGSARSTRTRARAAGLLVGVGAASQGSAISLLSAGRRPGRWPRAAGPWPRRRRLRPAEQGRQQVEPEPVDVHDLGPSSEGCRRPTGPRGVHAAEGVAAARVEVVGGAPGGEQVIGGVVEPPQGERGPKLAALRRVVVNDVEDDLDPGAVKGLHHLLELTDGGPPGWSRRSAGPARRTRLGCTPSSSRARGQQHAIIEELVNRQDSTAVTRALAGT